MQMGDETSSVTSICPPEGIEKKACLCKADPDVVKQLAEVASNPLI